MILGVKPRSTVLLRDTPNWGAGVPGLTGYELCVQLTRGYLAIIDVDDAEELSGYSWCAKVPSTSLQVRATRSSIPDEQGNRKTILMHREVSKPTDAQDVDHRDQHCHFAHKLVDNRSRNLRNVTASQNGSNRRKQVGCSSKFKGVAWYTRDETWSASIRVNRHLFHLGYFASEQEAAHAYNQAHQQHFPGISEGLNRIAI